MAGKTGYATLTRGNAESEFRFYNFEVQPFSPIKTEELRSRPRRFLTNVG
jgi:hypothetical protein